MKHKYKVMIAYLIYFSLCTTLGASLGYFLAELNIKEHHPILFFAITIVFGLAISLGLEKYIINKVK